MTGAGKYQRLSLASIVRRAAEEALERRFGARHQPRPRWGGAKIRRKKKAAPPAPPKRQRACGVCGELGHRADSARHKAAAAPQAPAVAAPAPPAPAVPTVAAEIAPPFQTPVEVVGPPALSAPRARAVRACSICGELGHRADNPKHRGERAAPQSRTTEEIPASVPPRVPRSAAEATERSEMIRRFMPNVQKIANYHVRRSSSRKAIADDIYSAGLEGLVRGVDGFDPTRGEAKPYVEQRISGAILDFLRGEDHLSRDHRANVKAGRADEVPPALRLDDDDEGLHDAIASVTADDPARTAERHRTLEEIERAAHVLKPRTREILRLVYSEGMTEAKVGERFGVTESRVSQILKDAHAAIRAELAGSTAAPPVEPEAVPPAPVRAPAIARPRPTRAPRHCGICGQEGHRADGPFHRGESATSTTARPPARAARPAAEMAPRRSFLPVLSAPIAPPPAPLVRADELEEVLAEAGGDADADDEVAAPPSMRTPLAAAAEEETEALVDGQGASQTEDRDGVEAPAPTKRLRWTPGPGGEEDHVPALEARLTHRSKWNPHTIAAKRIVGEREITALAVLSDEEADAILPRPRTRGDCANVPRPCPFVSCAHHLFLDVNEDTGTIKLNHPTKEPWELAETCALDVADAGGATLEAVGELLGVVRERVRQIEVRSLEKLKRGVPEATETDSPGPALRHPYGEVAA